MADTATSTTVDSLGNMLSDTLLEKLTFYLLKLIAEQFCHKMINYFNHKKGKGKGSLRDSTTHCNRRDTSIEAEFIGNTKKEENCVAPRHYQYEGLTSSLVEFKH